VADPLAGQLKGLDLVTHSISLYISSICAPMEAKRGAMGESGTLVEFRGDSWGLD